MMTIASLVPNLSRNLMDHVFNIARPVSGAMEHPEANNVSRALPVVKPVR
jgi:hypothetical protein